MKYLILKNGLIVAEFYNKGYALDFIDYQATLGKEFVLAIQNNLEMSDSFKNTHRKENK